VGASRCYGRTREYWILGEVVVSKSEKQLRKILTLWAEKHGVPEGWEPKPALVSWLMAWKKETK